MNFPDGWDPPQKKKGPDGGEAIRAKAMRVMSEQAFDVNHTSAPEVVASCETEGI
jgi:hypothetical protein